MCRYRYVYWACGDAKEGDAVWDKIEGGECYAGRTGVCHERSTYDPGVTDYSRKCDRCTEADRVAAEEQRIREEQIREWVEGQRKRRRS